MNEWISVKDRLPEKDEENKKKWCGGKSYNTIRVLCAIKQSSGKKLVKEGFANIFEDGTAFWRIAGAIDEVTHWMYLPKHPEEQ